MLNSTVKEIVVKDKKISGITNENGFVSADLVVSNVDSYFTYKHLLGDVTAAKKILKNERSSSAYIFYDENQILK